MTTSSETDQEVVTKTDHALHIAEKMDDAGENPYRPAAALLADLPMALRDAVINELHGAAWGTVESRRHDELCHCPRCNPERHSDCGPECSECRRVDPQAQRVDLLNTPIQ